MKWRIGKWCGERGKKGRESGKAVVDTVVVGGEER